MTYGQILWCTRTFSTKTVVKLSMFQWKYQSSCTPETPHLLSWPTPKMSRAQTPCGKAQSKFTGEGCLKTAIAERHIYKYTTPHTHTLPRKKPVEQRRLYVPKLGKIYLLTLNTFNFFISFKNLLLCVWWVHMWVWAGIYHAWHLYGGQTTTFSPLL